MKIKFVLFDLDGTLINSELFHFDCWNETLCDYNIIISASEYFQFLAGIPNIGNATYLKANYTIPATIPELVEKHEYNVQKRYRLNPITLMPHAIDALEFFKLKGIRMGLVTGSPRQDVDWVFQNTQLGQYFDISITQDDVDLGKPHPEPYAKASRFFSNNPAEFVVFEDSKVGVESARANRLRCLAIQPIPELRANLLSVDHLFCTLQEGIDFLVQEEYV